MAGVVFDPFYQVVPRHTHIAMPRVKLRHLYILLDAIFTCSLLGGFATIVLSTGRPTKGRCLPGNAVNVDAQGFIPDDLWAISNFFEVNIVFGSMSFTQVKVIDIVWDTVSLISQSHDMHDT